jgi:small subunit ribosomal protein S2
MQKPSNKELMDAGCHFGHLRKKWNPKMTPYIFTEHKGVHIIDLNRTAEGLERAALVMKAMAKSGKKVLFVATKKQARSIVQAGAERAGMPFVTERWLGGMLTNFMTIRKSVKKMHAIEKMLSDTSLTSITKKERLSLGREHTKLHKQLGGIDSLNRLPAAMFIVDIHHEHLALAEARKLGIKTIGIVDTNSDPTLVDFAIPSNDDASKAIEYLTNYVVNAIHEGHEERKAMRDSDKDERAGS